MPNRRAMLCLAVLLLPGAAAAWTADHTLRVVVGFPAGGAGDLTARLIAEMAAASLGQSAVVENRTGANGMIAAENIARGSPPDGYSVMQCPMGTMTISPNLPGLRPPIDVTTELVPVANLANSTYGLVVARDRFADVPALLAAARARPGALTFASAGIGSAQHLAGEMLKQMAKVDIVHVPYRGGAPAIVDLIAGRVDFFITNLADVSGQIRDGSVRLLAVADDTGHPAFPAPSLSGFVPGFSLTGWFGVCAARAMPAEAVAAWAGAIQAGLRQEAWRKRLLDNGLTPDFRDQQALAARIEANRRQFREVIGAAGIRAE